MIKWTPKSEQDLEKIYDYIKAHFDEKLALKKVTGIVEQVENILAHNPLAGSILVSNPLFSKLVVEGNSIYYCENPKDKSIYIVYIEARANEHDETRLSKEEV